MNVLFDSSALYKRYSGERGIGQVQRVQAQAQRISVAVHCKTEVASALSRQWREGLFTDDEYGRVLKEIELDFGDFDVLPLSRAVEQRAIAAMRQVALRAMDALHVGTAQAAGVDLFVTADRRQAQGAQALGLPIELIAEE